MQAARLAETTLPPPPSKKPRKLPSRVSFPIKLNSVQELEDFFMHEIQQRGSSRHGSFGSVSSIDSSSCKVNQLVISLRLETTTTESNREPPSPEKEKSLSARCKPILIELQTLKDIVNTWNAHYFPRSATLRGSLAVKLPSKDRCQHPP